MINGTLTRRQTLLGAMSLGAIAAVGPAATSYAKTTGATAGQVPYYYRFKHGDMMGTVVSDGILPLGDPSDTFAGASPEEVKAMLTNNFLGTSNLILEQNVIVLDTGGKRILFDTGMGHSTLFGTTTGQLMTNLAVAGIDPASIDAILLTHGHPDHVWGIMSKDGRRNFPNAQIYISQIDFDFWTDEAKLSIDGAIGAFAKGARDNLLPNRDRIIFISDGEEVMPGIQAVLSPGHTPGHMMFMLTSGGKTMAMIGDLSHHQVLLLERPRLKFKFDVDPELSAVTRVNMFEMIANERMPVLAYHFPWPGIGNIAKAGEGYRYYPAPMVMQEQPTE